MDPERLAALLLDRDLWMIVLASFALGLVGALLNSGEPYPPAEPPLPPRSGWSKFLDLLAGGIAAVAVLYLTNPETGVALIGGSLVAGYAGKAVLAALQARVLVAVAKKEAQTAVVAADDAKQTARAAIVARDRAKQDVSRLVAGIERLEGPATTGPVSVAELRQLGREVQSKHALHTGADVE
jgi:hypothetical protein